MSEREKPQPGRNETGERQRAAREERLAEALRKNLQKRKAQARDRSRGRAEPDSPASPSGDTD